MSDTEGQKAARRERLSAALAEQRPGISPCRVVRVGQRSGARRGIGSHLVEPDLVTVEAALQIHLADEPFITTMRTPGRDHDLALGLLYSEGLIDSAADVSTISHCGRPDQPGYGDRVNVTPGPGHAFDPDRVLQATRVGHAGCGVCGRVAVDDLLTRCAPRRAAGGEALPLSLVFRAIEALRARQTDFAATGGCHAAAALDRDGALLAHAEDVGRHNAVDKVIGALLRTRADTHLASTTPPLLTVLAISGRAGFELTQKAIAAGAAVLCSVSAPSSLAIQVAEAAGLCLLGFARDGRANVYAHTSRLADD